MKPTDDELEAMAARLETRIIQSTMIADAAAMLRACKAGDAPDHAEWDAAIEAAANVSERMSTDREGEQTPFIDDTAGHEADFGNSIAEAIRALKKGQQ